MQASPEMQKYFGEMEKKLKIAYELATEARKKGFDPEQHVDIPIAKNMAQRVEGLIGAIAPQIVDAGIPKRIEELEKKHGKLAWQVALIIAEEVARERFCKFANKKEAMEIGIRTGLAYQTVGIVSAPLEGFIGLAIKKRKDGKEYFAARFAGPIRGAGGTAAAFSVLLTDYIRSKFGYDQYDPDEKEIMRFVTEVADYHERVTNLQYIPSPEEIKFLISNIPVEIDGDPSERIEVSNYKDLDRVDTNQIRSGVCLVLAEGLAQKAPKIWKQLQKWGKDFDLEWPFLEKFLEIQKKKHAKTEEKTRLAPVYTYIEDLVAGRPVLSHPSRARGFRLRYGRSRTSGYSAASINPATMRVLNNYIAIGTQLKVERPGKAAAITSCSLVEGPVVKLKNGSVVKLNTEKEAKQYKDEIEEILFLGDILISYGDFFDRAHILVPPGYCEEWWAQELEKATVDLFGNLDIEKLSELLEIDVGFLERLLKDPLTSKIDFKTAYNISKKLNIPLHPFFTYHWNLLSLEEFSKLINWLDKAKVQKTEETVKIIIPLAEEKRFLELIGLPHVVATEFVVVEKDDAEALIKTLGIKGPESIENIRKAIEEHKDVLELINKISRVEIKDKSGTFIGARMGRPEKAKMRKLTGSPQVLFPVGDEGGRLRCFQAALEKGTIRSDFPTYRCEKCNQETIYGVCENCGEKTKHMFVCKICGSIETEECKHGKAATFAKKTIDVKHYFDSALKKLGERTYPDLIKGVRGTSNKDHIPENLLKGILRAKHGIYVNKDGTTRYDMTELPITHFKPKEVNTSIEKLKELGYEKDIKGLDLENKDQVLELKPQDIILPANNTSDEPSDEVLFRVANFIDELLVKLYGLEPFYGFEAKEDLIGHLIIGLAPHTSSAMLGRIIGFSQTQGFFAHPLFHAAMRRDCDGDESCVLLLMDSLLNFSRQYLPDKRGSRTMDSPLVLTSLLNPSEVDDMAHRIDIAWRYPLEFYEACLQYKKPWEIKIKQLGDFLGTEKQYEGMGFTHNNKNLNKGVRCSAYKTRPSMEEKLLGQMELAEKINAVDTVDVARLVIEKHFLKDTKGNLRKFSMQKFRCSKCNTKYRRPPLSGRCTVCSGPIIFTIAEGSVVKYLQPSMSLATKYNVPSYLKQSLELLQRRIEGVFGKDKEKQEGLGRWFG